LTGGTIVTKADMELLAGPDSLRGMSAAYLQGQPKSDPLVSPLYGDLIGLPPMIIQVGSEETLLDDSVRLAGKAGAAKVKVHLEIYPDCFHVFQAWHSQVPEAREALERAAAFLKAHLIQPTSPTTSTKME
jgi:monoterpene epsilon-lactone hydrolase